MMRSGMHKPPVPPKPSLAARSGLSPSTPRREGLSLPSPGTPRRVKPQLAPKPCLSKIVTSLESKPLTLKSQVPATQRTEVSNSQKGIQQENKKPNWDYIIPICLCSGKNCTCVRNTSANLDKHEKDSKSGKAGVRVAVANGGEKIMTNDHVTNHKPLQETLTADRNLNTDTSQVSVRPCVPHRTWSDEANGNVILQSEPAGGTEEDALGSEQTPCAPKAESRRKPVPVPVPRKPRTAVLTRQEKVEEEREEIMRQEGRDINVNEVKVSLERKGNSSPAKNQTISQSATNPCAVQAPPPRKRPFLFTPEKAETSAPLSFPKDVEEDDLGWDSSSHEMEVSLDKEGEMLEQEKGEARHQEAVYADFRSSPPVSRLLETPELSQPPGVTASAEDVPVKVVPKKPQRGKSPMAWRQRNELSEEKQEEKVRDERGQTPALKERVMKELPLPPAERPGKNRTATGAIEPPRRSLGKQRAKSFSGADFVRSEGQSRNSFRKLLDLKLSVKMLPKLMAKGGPSPDGAANENVNVRERKMPPPLIGVEQSVDGDEYGEDADLYYENIPYYEEIADYINVDVGTALTSAQSSLRPPTAWQSMMYNDEDIYEEQEPYMSFEKPAEQRQCRTQTDCERDSVDEEVVSPDNGPSDDGVLANSSDDDDDSSSISSKGDCEQPEESPNPSGQKNKSKIQHIAREIMTSESVFVDVLKLLHVDFRGAVDKASRQNGKPVIEERLLNQILYYLPQLYELNQSLLRELKQRVAKWDENAQLSDIFLKKGPYLKMYSTYIREFDKNVALLEEQSKRNSTFGAVVREFEASPLCANLALKHYLLKPVQRIPQYQLLLTDYLKNLSEDSADYKDTQAALAIVKEVANHANDIMKQGDNFQKLIQVQCRLVGNHEIVQPGRFFLKEGVLKKLSRKVMQPRMFFLFSDSLLYTTPVQSGQYKVNNMFSLAGMKVSKPSQEAYQNELNIESVERSFTLSASSASERDEWLEAISTAINDYTRKKITFISGKSSEEKEPQGYDDGAPLGSKAPIWIPDLRTTMCMICTCEFTVAWRRHHCRACGKVVCKSCSSNKYRLEYRKNELLRVCDQCFLVLQQQKYKTVLPTTASPGKGATFAFTRKQKKIPAALKEVSANTDSSMSGYLQMSKSDKKQGKRLWFVIKDKVLYTYAASEDVAALKSQPLLGFELKVDSPQSLQFKLYHKKTLYFIFKADDAQTAQRWIDSFREAFDIS